MRDRFAPSRRIRGRCPECTHITMPLPYFVAWRCAQSTTCLVLGISKPYTRQTPPSSPFPVFRSPTPRYYFMGGLFTRFCKQKLSHDATSPALGWFHPFRDFVRRKDHEGCTALALALKVPHQTFGVSLRVFCQLIVPRCRRHVTQVRCRGIHGT